MPSPARTLLRWLDRPTCNAASKGLYLLLERPKTGVLRQQNPDYWVISARGHRLLRESVLGRVQGGLSHAKSLRLSRLWHSLFPETSGRTRRALSGLQPAKTTT